MPGSMTWTGKACDSSVSELAVVPEIRALVPSARETCTPRDRAGVSVVRPKTTSWLCPWRMSRSELRVRNERPRPKRKIASSSEVLPDPLPPQMRLRCGCRQSSACSRQRRLSTVSSASPKDVLQPHRHDDVAGMNGARCMNEAAAVRIRQADLDLVALDGAQGIE